MRISDWSSDVCSSDLSLCDTDSTGPDRAKERKGALMQTCVCVRQGIPLNPSGLSPAPCSCLASKGAAMASFHLAVKTIGRSAGRSATAAAAYRAGVEITDERSEEHTSELQSLMRISYAVFCLKKKKTTKARHLHNYR